MAKIETYFDCDLKKAVQVQPLNGNVFSLDNNGNRIGVRIFDNGVKTTVTGTVTGRAILADNSTVNLNGGLTTVNGQSVAYVDVPQGALLIPGTIKITIQLTASGVITTLAAILSTVYQTKTDNVITPSAQVIADWNATISSAIQEQDAAIAAETAAREAADSDLKSAFNSNARLNINSEWFNKFQNLNYGEWENKYYDGSGHLYPNSSAIITKDFLPDDVEFIYVPTGYVFNVCTFNADGTFVRRQDYTTTTSWARDLYNGMKYKIFVVRSDNANINISESVNVFMGNLLYSATPEIQYGYIDSSGVFQNGIANIITRDFVTAKVVKIDPTKFDKTCLVKYNNDGTFISRDTSFAAVTYRVIPQDGYKYKLAIINNGQAILPTSIIGGIEFIDKVWENDFEYGLISQSDGSISYNTNIHLYTPDAIPSNVNSVTPASGIRIAIAMYQNGALVSRSNFLNTTYVFDHERGYTYKITIAKDNSAIITADEIDNLVEYEIITQDTIWAKGYVATDGVATYGNTMLYTPHYIASDIIGVELLSMPGSLGIVVYNSNGTFQERVAFKIRPYYAFDHANHKYRICYNHLSPVTLDDSKNVRFVKNSFLSNSIMGRMVGISDMKSFISGDGNRIAYDEERGMCYVIYEASTGEYGESFFDIRLSVYPVDQPFRAEYYNVISTGQTSGELTFSTTMDVDIMMLGSVARIFFYDQNTETNWYIDFDKTTNQFSAAQKVYIKIGDNDPVVYNKTNMRQYYIDNNLTLPSTMWPQISTDIIKDGDYYYTTLTFGILSYPIISRSTDGAVWEFLYRIDKRIEYEAALAKVGSDFYVSLRIDKVYVIPDDFSSITAISYGDAYIENGNTKPEMIAYGDDVLIGVSANGVFPSITGKTSGTRRQITFYKGHGTDLSNYKPLFSLIHKDGIAQYCLLNVNGMVYLIPCLGHLYLPYHPNEAACKDGIYHIPLGDMSLLENLSIT